MERAAYLLIFLYFLRRVVRKLTYKSRLPVRRCRSRDIEIGYTRLVVSGNMYDLCSNFCVKTPHNFSDSGKEDSVEETLTRLFGCRLQSASGGEYEKVIAYGGRLAPRDIEFDENGCGKDVPAELRGILAELSEEFVRLMR